MKLTSPYFDRLLFKNRIKIVIKRNQNLQEKSQDIYEVLQYEVHCSIPT